MYLESDSLLFLQEQSPGRIEPRLQLLNDNFLLRLELVGLKSAADHSIRFDFQSDIPAVRCEIEIIGSEIMRGERIVAAAVLEGNKIDLSLLEALGTFEQHVFQKMGFSGLAELLIPRTHAIPNHRRHERRGMDFFRQHNQTVVKDGAPNIFRSKR